MIRKLFFVIPLVACLVLAVIWGRPLSWILLSLVAVALIFAVLAAVHHAEVIAHRVGEPFGTLILALAVTVIEVALIVTMMLSSGTEANALARDTVFAMASSACACWLGRSGITFWFFASKGRAPHCRCLLP
jgi:Ca2+:H+ antiporter